MSKNTEVPATVEPQELDIPVSTEVRRMVAELGVPARVEAVAARVAGLKPKVSKAIAANLKEATTEIAKSTRVAELEGVLLLVET